MTQQLALDGLTKSYPDGTTTRVVLDAVDAIGIAGQGVHAGQALEAVGEAQEEFRVAPATAVAAYGDGGFLHRRRGSGTQFLDATGGGIDIAAA